MKVTPDNTLKLRANSIRTLTPRELPVVAGGKVPTGPGPGGPGGRTK